MILYFIKSEYWSKHYKIDTWWGPERNGYTCFLPDAGIYTETDKIEMEKHHTEDRCLFVPITQGLLKKATRQLKKRIDDLTENSADVTRRYVAEQNEIFEQIKKSNDKLSKIKSLEEPNAL